MSKRELIDAIIQVNHTAAPEFLAKFEESDLKAYLDRVCSARTHVIRSSTATENTYELTAV